MKVSPPTPAVELENFLVAFIDIPYVTHGTDVVWLLDEPEELDPVSLAVLLSLPPLLIDVAYQDEGTVRQNIKIVNDSQKIIKTQRLLFNFTLHFLIRY